ncbi:MAG: YybH family protein [Gemmatimonadales bacterium]
MRIVLLVAVMFGVAPMPSLVGQTHGATRFPEVEGLMVRLADAVRRQDGVQMTSVYVLEDPLVFSNHGLFITKRDSLHAIYLAWDSTKTKGTFIRFEDLQYRAMGPDAVLVVGRLRLAWGTPTGTAADTLPGTWTGVFERRQGRWGLAHEHESFRR